MVLEAEQNRDTTVDLEGDFSLQTQPTDTTDTAVTPDPAPSENWWEGHLDKDVEYKAGDKMIREPLGDALKRSQQGYHYAQKMQEVNTRLTEATQKLQEGQGLAERYGHIDEFSKQNPGYNEFLNEQWENRNQWNVDNQTLDSNPQVAGLQRQVADLTKQLGDVNQFVNQTKQTQEDQELDMQVKSIREKYTDIDFAATNPENGKSREMEVLEYMKQNGIRSAQTAFRDLYHDDIVRLEVQKVLEGQSAQTKQDRANGIMGRTSTPVLTDQLDISRLNDNQLLEAASKDPLWD